MPPTPSEDQRLRQYREKRDASLTPEPFGGEGGGLPSGGRLFVFHKHHARNLHWDLRLELDGALESWAVPKGPSPNPEDKRLAVHVEPHPLDYAEFEGVIPEGSYGAGPSIVWDKGVWVPLIEPHEGLEGGKLLFELRGFKVRGVWTLVHTPRSGEKNWLLIKETGDAYVDREAGTEDYPDDSIYSGLLVDELPDVEAHRERVAALAGDAGASRRDIGAADVEVMKATRRSRPFDDPGWVFEIKYDGYRLLAERPAEGPPLLMSRNGNDLTPTFPDVARAVRGLPYEGLLLDGEVVVHDASGLPSFGRLQKRGRLQNPMDVARAALEHPGTYYAFDLLAVEGWDLRDLPLVERKTILREILPSAGPMRYSDHVPERGKAVYRQMESLGLEGIVAKRADSPYRSGRSRDWYKIRVDRTDDFVVVGWTDPKGSRAGFGALHVAQYVDAGSDGPREEDAGREGAAADGAGERAAGRPLLWIGSVGTGFSEAHIDELSAELARLGEALDEAVAAGEATEPPVVAPADVPTVDASAGAELPRGREHHWVLPELVIEVKYREITEAGVLRHASFLRVREDKPPEECVRRLRGGDGREEPAGAGDPRDPGEAAGAGTDGSARGASGVGGESAPEATPGARAAAAAGGSTGERPFPLTNLDKVFWPASEGDDASPVHTKGDLIAYYEAISGWLLPYLRDRPLVLTRFPDGIQGKSFYQKDAPSWAPDWIRTATIHSESGDRDLSYFVADDVDTLLYVANLGAIPLHVWHSRVGSLDRPDWCLLDLDPKEAPFSHVVEIARFLHDLCGDIGLPHYVKTSGSTGLHVMIPLAGQVSYDHSRALGELLARLAVGALPEIATVERVMRRRGGKVYVDYLQNRRGQLVAAPFCVRAKAGAPVSAPLLWEEVGPELSIADHTIDSVPGRMRALEGGDPMRPVLTEAPDLLAALEALHARTEGGGG